MAEKHPNDILATQLSATVHVRDEMSTKRKEPEVDAKGDGRRDDTSKSEDSWGSTSSSDSSSSRSSGGAGDGAKHDVEAVPRVGESGDRGVVVPGNTRPQDSDQQRAHQADQPKQNHQLVDNYKYENIEQLGTGGFGTVCKAEHKHDGQHYAVKIVPLQGCQPGSESERKIMREVKNLAALIHDHVVRYHTSWIDPSHPDICVYDNVPSTTSESDSRFRDSKRSSKSSKPSLPHMLLEGGGDSSSGGIYFGEEDSPENKAATAKHNPGVVQQSISNSSLQRAVPNVGNMMPERFLHIKMELCDRTLREWLMERNIAVTGPSRSVMCEEDCHTFLEQLLKGLAYIHKNGVLHRDLKPPNVFLMKIASGVYVVKIGDFGLSRLMPRSSSGATGSCPEADEEKLTKKLGTSTYASPEQLQGPTYNQKSDMYSLGVIMLELYHPFGESEMERRSCLQRLREGTLPEDFATKFRVQAKYVKLLTSKVPSERPTASEVQEELDGKLFCTKDQTIKELKEQMQLLKEELEKLRPDQVLKSENKMCPPSPRDKDDMIASYETQIRDLQKQVKALKIEPGYLQDKRRSSGGKTDRHPLEKSNSF